MPDYHTDRGIEVGWVEERNPTIVNLALLSFTIIQPNLHYDLSRYAQNIHKPETVKWYKQFQQKK